MYSFRNLLFSDFLHIFWEVTHIWAGHRCLAETFSRINLRSSVYLSLYDGNLVKHVVIKHCDISSWKDTRELCYSKQLDFIFSVSQMNMSFLKTIFHSSPLMGIALDSSGCCFNYLAFSPHLPMLLSLPPHVYGSYCQLSLPLPSPQCPAALGNCVFAPSAVVVSHCESSTVSAITGRYCAAVVPLYNINLNGFNQ